MSARTTGTRGVGRHTRCVRGWTPHRGERLDLGGYPRPNGSGSAIGAAAAAGGTRADGTTLIKKAVPHQRVIFTLELLTGPLHGVYDPSGYGVALFAFFAGVAESERGHRGESLQGRASTREHDPPCGRPKVIDDDMAAYARSLRANGGPLPGIARKPVITSGGDRASGPRAPPSTAPSPRTPTHRVSPDALQGFKIDSLPL